MRALFTLTLFVGSFLLFLVEPMVAKMILPTFGGSPQVWNSSVVFFQLALLVGYLYAHVVPQKLGLARQTWLHVGLLLVALLLLPVSTHTGFFQMVREVVSGQRNSPVTSPPFWVLVGMAGLVGLPFLVLAAGAPLLQRWFANTRDPAAKDPYFLYGASNVGNLLGLFAYPFYVEPRLTLSEQSALWKWGYGGLAVLVALCAIAVRRAPARAEDAGEEASVGHAPLRSRVLWTLLAAVPSSLMLGVTTYLTTNLTPMPLLWVVPLALYLVTFILAFARWGERPIPVLGRLLPLIATPLALALILESSEPIGPLAFFHLLVFFVAAWMCHARLNAARPGAGRLTEFYFYVALGGVLGGAFNALVAPLVFSGLYEYPLALVGAMLLRPRWGDDQPGRSDLWVPAGVGLFTLASALYAKQTAMPPSVARTVLTLGLPAVLCFLAVDRRLRFGLALGAVFLVSFSLHTASSSNLVLAKRSFFGVHRVLIRDNGIRELVHGNTIHGRQDPSRPGIPLTYYHPTGPIGQIFRALDHHADDVALVGLGVGSLAAYGYPGQRMTYYEIDPDVVAIAKNADLFTFLRESKAKVNVVLGDARLTLADSKDKYDLIVLDAFSSDAIPLHLLTREAIEMYLSKLKPKGFLAFHISNRYLQLEEVLTSTANQMGLANKYAVDGPTIEEAEAGKTQSAWYVLARDPAHFEPIKKVIDFSPYEPYLNVRPWSDDFSNVLSVFQPND